MKDESENEKPEVKYYGKKAYYVNPLLVRKKLIAQKTPDYKNEETKPILKQM